jgi:hypothetical protein
MRRSRRTVTRESDFGSWDEALRAAGIPRKQVAATGSQPRGNHPILLLICARSTNTGKADQRGPPD